MRVWFHMFDGQDFKNMSDDRKTQEPDGARAQGGKVVNTSKVKFGNLMQDAIGRSLQAHFDDIASAPVPDKFLVLLAELEAKEIGRDR